MVQNTSVARQMTFTANERILHGDVVAYPGAVTDLGQINPDVITDLRAISDDAGLGDAGVA